MLEKKGRVCEGDTNARKEKLEGKEYKNPSDIVYHENNGSSIPNVKKLILGMGIKEKNCAWCGKNFCPTPQWVYGDCCKYTCSLRYEEQKQDALNNAREVVLLNPDTFEDVTKFKSAREAAEFAETSAKDIRLVCNGLRETAGKYAWRWADEGPLRQSGDYSQKEKKAKTDDTQEERVPMTVVLRKSINDKVEKIADKRCTSRNKVVNEIIEKELSKKEYNL